MKLPELLSRFYFDGRFHNRISNASFSWEQLVQRYKDYSHGEDYELRASVQEKGDIYLEIGLVDGIVFFSETEQSREKRIRNSCLKCNLQGAVFTYQNNSEAIEPVLIDRNWKWQPPNNEWRIQVSHDNIGGWICSKCKNLDPDLGRYLANNRILNAMSQP